MVLSTRWHTLSDEDIQANVASLSSVQSPSDESSHPYHDTIRILSAACERLVKQAAALERTRRSLQQQEARRKRAAERAVKDLKPGQRETGQQLLRAIYALEPTEPIPVLGTTLDSSRSPNTLPTSISEAMQDVWTPPPREQPTFQPSQPLDITPSDAISIISGSRSRASSFTPSSIASHSIRSEKTTASKTFLGNWFGRSVSRAEEPDDPDTDADVISVASGNISVTTTGNSTAKMVSGVFRKGRNVFNSFGITPTPPSSIPTPPRPEPVEDSQDIDARSAAALSYTGSPISKITSLPLQAPLMSPVLPAVTTFSTKAPSITALSLDSSDLPAHVPPDLPTPVHPAEHLKQYGHPAHLRAIVLATRVMTADPGSILADRGADTNQFIARAAVTLVEEARQKGIVTYEPGGDGLKRKKSKSKNRSTSIPREGDAGEEPERAVTATAKLQGASASLGRTLAEQNQLRDKAAAGGKAAAGAGSGGNIGSKFRNFAPMAVAALGSPLLSSFPRSSNATSRPAPTSNPPPPTNSNANPVAGPATAVGPGGTIKKPPGRGTVELSSIVPVRMQPPTQFLSRAYTSSRLTSPTFRPQLASRFTLDLDSEGQAGKKLGMTDRYGFIYGVNAYDLRLLQRAREASSTAPACLTGMKKVQEREIDEDEPGIQSPERILESLEADTSIATDADASMATDLDRSMTASEILEVSKSGSSGKSRPNSKRTPTLNTLPRAAPTTANTTPATATTSPPSSSTVRKLLDQITALHDTQQAAQKAEWDAFLKRRRQGGGGTLLGFIGGADGEEESDEEREWGLGMVGVGRMDAASAKEFLRLVRGGVPLVYRDKVWSECSGATELREPGVFQELLSSHEGVNSPTLNEIEKDVYLEGMTARMWQADKLMKVESEVKSLMPHNELVRRREAHVAMLQSYA
ncbi:hypothetical protein FS749_005962 [Ceratobasidium sp. UAMH 11750]|nr:hypothetical protein FS749_005962 [Ceratobasidium sp. UAMH 11750]